MRRISYAWQQYPDDQCRHHPDQTWTSGLTHTGAADHVVSQVLSVTSDSEASGSTTVRIIFHSSPGSDWPGWVLHEQLSNSETSEKVQRTMDRMIECSGGGCNARVRIWWLLRVCCVLNSPGRSSLHSSTLLHETMHRRSSMTTCYKHLVWSENLPYDEW